MNVPRLAVDLTKIEANARLLVDRLRPRGIRVLGVTKAALGAPEVAAAYERAGVHGVGDSRIQNLGRVRSGGSPLARTLIRSPMRSEVAAVVRDAATSLNSELAVLEALDAAARRARMVHGVVLMVELGDLREGIEADDLVALAIQVERRKGLALRGIGTNLACQSGVVPDQSKMEQLSDLAAAVEASLERPLEVVSGGNSANLAWAASTPDVGRVDELRLGEAILLGTEPLHRCPIAGLHLDACTLHAEVIEVQQKSAQPWGTLGQGAYGPVASRTGSGRRRQAIVAVGRQDVDPDGLTPPTGLLVLGASSDHLVLDADDLGVAVGDCVSFGLDYSALVRAMTSPFVAKDFFQP